MPKFAKNMELYEVLPKICQKYGVMPSSSKNMELCEVLRKIWSYAKFCQKYGIMRSFAENMELCGFRVTWVFPPKLGFFFEVLR